MLPFRMADDECIIRSTRYLIVMRDGKPCGKHHASLHHLIGTETGFLHFGFTLQGDVLDQPCGTPVLKVFNLNLEDSIQRQVIGRASWALVW